MKSEQELQVDAQLHQPLKHPTNKIPPLQSSYCYFKAPNFLFCGESVTVCVCVCVMYQGQIFNTYSNEETNTS